MATLSSLSLVKKGEMYGGNGEEEHKVSRGKGEAQCDKREAKMKTRENWKSFAG